MRDAVQSDLNLLLVVLGGVSLLVGALGIANVTLVVVAVSAYQQWTPVLGVEVPLASPLVGLVTGLLAGAYPSMRAARMEPIDALRSGT